MARFICGLLGGGAAGALAWWLGDGDMALAIFVGCMVALIIWFTRAADEIIESGAVFGRSLVRIIEDLLP
jgi:hypothetical protein